MGRYLVRQPENVGAYGQAFGCRPYLAMLRAEETNGVIARL